MAVSLDTSLGVSCPVCYTDYSDEVAELVPRILPCGHTYCTNCLEKLLNSEDDQQEVLFSIRQRQQARPHVYKVSRSLIRSVELKCPICNTSNHVQRGEISSLTKNYAVLNCKPKADNSTTTSSGKSGAHYCPEHDHDQRVFCKDCKAIICVYCQLYGAHKGHDCALAADLVKPALETLESAEVTLNEHLRDIIGAESAVKNAMDVLRSSQKESLDAVQRYYETVAELMGKEKVKQMERISSWVEDQWDILQAQLQSLTDAQNECETAMQDCRALIGGDPLEALSQHEDKQQDIGSICKKIRGLSYEPLITPLIKCTCGSTKVIMQKISKGCNITAECSQEVHEQQRESGEEGIGGASFQGKAIYTSSPLNNTSSFPRMEPLNIRFHESSKLEPLQLNLREPSQLKPISIEHLETSTESELPCVPRGSVESLAAEFSNSASKVWIVNSKGSSFSSLHDHSMNTSDQRAEITTELSMSPQPADHEGNSDAEDADQEQGNCSHEISSENAFYFQPAVEYSHVERDEANTNDKQ